MKAEGTVSSNDVIWVLGCWLSPAFQSMGCSPFLGHEFSLEDHSQLAFDEIESKENNLLKGCVT